MVENSPINFFAKTNFRNQERIFGIKEDDRRRHVYIIGKTGMGKTTLEENMAIQDIRNGKGVCVVDPHGEFAEKMLRAVPASRVNDVIYFNPADSENPVAFNILESVDEDKKSLVASGMMGVFKKIWPDVWSARMEHILNNTILALLDYPGSTMLGVNRMMFDKDYRKRVYGKIKDPMVKSFWINEFDKWEDRFRKEAVAAIQNKVGQFLSSPIIRHIVGQPKSTIDMRDIMDNEKILIVNLSKGRIGEDAMRLLGGMVVTKLQLAAMGRVDVPEAQRKDFYLYVDEFQNFATESFANILSEARKYRLCLILAHQYIRQLVFDNNTTVRDSIFGNVGTMITYRIGAEDAEFMEKEFEPIFMMNDLVNLTKFQVYLKLMIDGIAGDAFSATALPPIDLSDTAANAEKVIRVSRERYGRPRADIEEKISRWSGMLPAENVKIISSEEQAAGKIFENNSEEFVNHQTRPVVNTQPRMTVTAPPQSIVNVQSGTTGISPKVQPTVKITAERTETKERVMYESVCDSCEEKILVPFVPDPNRPAFCKECLKDYQRARERAKQEQMNHKENKGNYPPASRKTETVSSGSNEADQQGEILVFSSQDKPLTLGQLDHMSPKKFKSRPKS